jgi:hypothetical protein
VSASSGSERLSAHDTLYFASSNAAVPLSVAGLFSVGRDRECAALTVDRLRDHLEQRLDALPRFRQVVRPHGSTAASSTHGFHSGRYICWKARSTAARPC